MSADATFFENGINKWNDQSQFFEKQWIYALDQNSGQYSSGQVQFDLSSLSNSRGYINWSEGYLTVPLVCVADSIGQMDFGAVIKNGYYQLINSVNVKIGNQDVNNMTSFSNLHINYKVLTSMSYNDLLTSGSALGVWPDNALSGTYTGSAAGAAGVPASGTICLRNNNISIADSKALLANTGAYGSGLANVYNDGLFKRALYNSFDSFGNANLSGLVTENQITNNWRNYTKWDNTNKKQVYYIQALIRLKDIHDCFNKMNLPIAGAYVRLILNLNLGSVSVLVPNAKKNSDATVSSTTIQGQTFPFMLTDSITNQTQLADTTYTIGVGIGKYVTSNTTYPNSNSSCRIYVPLYQMTPEYEKKFLESGVTRTIQYHDVYQFLVSSRRGGDQVNVILSNGIQNMKKLIIVPVLNSSSNLGVSPLVSPLCSEPGTPTMQISLTNFNINVSGKNIYNQNQVYDFENFLEEVRPANNINGGLYDGLSCGLIGLQEWQNNYRYYVVNLARRLPIEKNIAKSLQLICQINNPSTVLVDLYCFVEYEREFEIDCSTGTVKLE